MMELSDVLIVELVVRTIFGAILTLLLLVALRMACAKMKVLLPFARLKFRYVILFVVAWSILLFIGTAGIVKVSSKRDISTLVRKLRTCTSLKARNSFDSEDIVIVERETIKGLVDVMDNARYKRWKSGGYIDTMDVIDIKAYKNETQIAWVRIIAGFILETGRPISSRRYECSDADLLNNVRKAIGARGVYFDDVVKEE